VKKLLEDTPHAGNWNSSGEAFTQREVGDAISILWDELGKKG
jgi:hypothetical protein